MADFCKTEGIATRKKALLEELAILERKTLEQKVAEVNSDIRCISWQDTFGNRYRQKLHPAMLGKNGHVERRNILPLGSKRQEFSDSRQWLDVHYDQKYVTEKIIIEILRPLRVKDRASFDALMAQVWEVWEGALSDMRTAHPLNNDSGGRRAK